MSFPNRHKGKQGADVTATASSSFANAFPMKTSHQHCRSSSLPSSTAIRGYQQLTIKNILKDVQVPSEWIQGVDVMRVYSNGSTYPSFLTLSEDKFTLYLTTERKNSGNFGNSPLHLFQWARRRNKRNNHSLMESKATNVQARIIDIAAIDRIQRGRVMRNGSVTTAFAYTNGYPDDEMLDDDSSKCFSILFRGGWTLDFMFVAKASSSSPNHILPNKLLDALDAILQTYKEQKQRVSKDVLLLRYHWLEAVSDKDKAEHINSHELHKLLLKMNYFLKPRELQDFYEKFARTIGLDRKMRRQGLTFEQTCTLLHKLKRDSWIVKPINIYWNNVFGEFMKNGKPRQTVSDKTFLEKFLHQTQGEISATLEDVQRLFRRLQDLELPHLSSSGSGGGEASEPGTSGHHLHGSASDGMHAPSDPHRLDKQRFEAFLLMDENDAFDPQREEYQASTMHRPISEYWINSSHNTYLTGDQLTSQSSVDMYSNALYRGCRCLELDIWDGDFGEDGIPRPVVWHGHTMTSKILFRDIIEALKLFLNFHPDTFPLVLSFENHCSLPFQEVMAEQLVEILGKSLHIPKEESLLLGRLPSPMELRGMVVIKGRRPKNFSYDDYDTDDDVSDDGAPSTQYSGGGGDHYQPMPSSSPKVKAHHKICPALARLTLFHGSKLSDWESSHMNPTHHMHSFSENKVRSLSRKTDRMQWTIYNQSHMSRTYPAGSRIDSSNYMPILPWSVGCQLVSLNFQTADTALLLNDGRFRENGQCGYVLKPVELLELQSSPRKNPMKISIRVLSGSCLPKPKDKRGDKCIDPYVRVSVFDVKNGIKEDVVTYQTGVVYNNGFFPIWNEGKMKFTVENWASAMLQLSIYDKETPPSSGEFVATSAIPISCLRQGLRSVKLNDSTNTRSDTFDFASLLIEVTKEWGETSERLEIFNGSSHSSKLVLEQPRLERSRTDNSRGSANATGRIAKPKSVQRAHTEAVPRSPYSNQASQQRHRRVLSSPLKPPTSPRLEKGTLARVRTDQPKGDSSLAEF